MKLLRRARESEVIAEFLKNEFYHEEFHRDREQFEALVMQGDPLDERGNALRRALLFRRRGPMWRELPSDTQWWEVQLAPEDIHRIFVFPRAHWRKIADGSFLLSDVVDRIHAHASESSPSFVSLRRLAAGGIETFVARIRSLSQRLQATNERSSILLIGTAEQQPMLIFEGNHRFTAALLASPNASHPFRVFFGCSPNMARCCWYRTSIPNLLRYAAHRVIHLGYDREADVYRVMKELDKKSAQEFVSPIGAGEVISESKTAPGNFS